MQLTPSSYNIMWILTSTTADDKNKNKLLNKISDVLIVNTFTNAFSSCHFLSIFQSKVRLFSTTVCDVIESVSIRSSVQNNMQTLAVEFTAKLNGRWTATNTPHTFIGNSCTKKEIFNTSVLTLHYLVLHEGQHSTMCFSIQSQSDDIRYYSWLYCVYTTNASYKVHKWPQNNQFSLFYGNASKLTFPHSFPS